LNHVVMALSTYQKVFDDRKRRVRGLWKRGVRQKSSVFKGTANGTGRANSLPSPRAADPRVPGGSAPPPIHAPRPSRLGSRAILPFQCGFIIFKGPPYSYLLLLNLDLARLGWIGRVTGRGGGSLRSVQMSGGTTQNHVAAAGTAAHRRRLAWIYHDSRLGWDLAGFHKQIKGDGAPQSGNIRYIVISQSLKWQQHWQQTGNGVATLRSSGLRTTDYGPRDRRNPQQLNASDGVRNFPCPPKTLGQIFSESVDIDSVPPCLGG
jgi:hypothetical protein